MNVQVPVEVTLDFNLFKGQLTTDNTRVIADHGNGDVEVLTCTINEDEQWSSLKLTFLTDRFSTFKIVKVQPMAPQPVVNGGPTYSIVQGGGDDWAWPFFPSETSATESSSSPSASVDSSKQNPGMGAGGAVHLAVSAGFVAVACGAAFVIGRKKKD